MIINGIDFGDIPGGHMLGHNRNDYPPLTCLVPDCERPWAARIYCSMHYQRFRRTGSTDPTPVGRPEKPKFSDQGVPIEEHIQQIMQRNAQRAADRSPEDLAFHVAALNAHSEPHYVKDADGNWTLQ